MARTSGSVRGAVEKSPRLLDAAVGEALQSFTPQECMNYFASSGYDAA